jgi:hypothetical protein
MKACIIKRYYQSPRNPEINQTLYLKTIKGGEYVTGDWTGDDVEAYVFTTKRHATAILRLMKMNGLSVIEK